MVVVRKQKIENPLVMKVNGNPYGKLLMKNFIKRCYNINKTNIGEGIEKPW
jgi:EAL domain-containing protein (putative c-di-GMP-specific phosphodiesterase class I)